MTEVLLIASMVVVTIGFAALALTDSARARAARPGLRRAAVALWWVILVVGWGVFAWLALGTAGGLDVAAEWFADQSFAMRVGMWALLLPWTAALALWGTGLAEFVRVAGVVAIAVLTFGLATRLPREQPR